MKAGKGGCDSPEHLDLEAQLRESVARYRELFDNVPIGIFRSTLDGILLTANAKVLEASGFDSIEAINRLGLEGVYVHPTDRQRLMDGLVQADVAQVETQFLRPDGKIVDVRIKARIARDVQGEPQFLEGTLEDVTERKQVETALKESERRLRTLLETISDWAWEVDSNCVFTYVSPGVRDLLGYEPEEILGKKPMDLMGSEDAQRFQPILDVLTQSQSHAVLFEHTMKSRNGTDVVLEVCGLSFCDAEGKVVGFRGVSRDISQRRRADRALRESQHMLQLVLDTIPVRVFWKDLQSVYLGCNKTFAEDADLTSPDAVAGLTDYDLLWKAEESEFYRTCDRRVMDSDTPEYHIVEPQQRKDGTEAWLDTNKIPLHGPNGQVVGILGTYEDITVLKRVEVELAKRNVDLVAANEELERLHRVKDEFIAMVSHEFRTPLVTGIGYLEMLLSGRFGYLSDVAHEKMTVALRNLKRQARLIDDILSFHRLSHKEIRYVPQLKPTHLATLFKECSEEFLVRTGRDESRVQWQVVPDIPPVLADEEMIRRVIANLMSNTERHAGDQAVVSLTAQLAQDGRVRVSVADDGQGIPPELIQTVFEPFVTSTKLSGGTGLGLAVVRAILIAHGTTPVLKSEIGQGTTIWFELPAAP